MARRRASLCALLTALVALSRLAIAEPGSGSGTGPYRPHLYFGGLDEAAQHHVSQSTSSLSDATVALTALLPVALELSHLDGDSDTRMVTYGGAIAADLAVVQIGKWVFERPRPYNFRGDPAVDEFARRSGADAHHSFPSSHAAVAFAAATTAGWYEAATVADLRARTTVWTAGAALAGLTATLRVRAGWHYPSDVVAGALIGTAAGALASYRAVGGIHVREQDVAGMLFGVAAGSIVAMVLPSHENVIVPLPFVTAGGGGVSFSVVRGSRRSSPPADRWRTTVARR